MPVQNRYLKFLVNPNLQGIWVVFELSFENEKCRRRHAVYLFPKVEIKDYNVITNRRDFFVHLINKNIETCVNIRKTATRLNRWF